MPYCCFCSRGGGIRLFSVRLCNLPVACHCRRRCRVYHSMCSVCVEKYRPKLTLNQQRRLPTQTKHALKLPPRATPRADGDLPQSQCAQSQWPSWLTAELWHRVISSLPRLQDSQQFDAPLVRALMAAEKERIHMQRCASGSRAPLVVTDKGDYKDAIIKATQIGISSPQIQSRSQTASASKTPSLQETRPSRAGSRISKLRVQRKPNNSSDHLPFVKKVFLGPLTIIEENNSESAQDPQMRFENYFRYNCRTQNSNQNPSFTSNSPIVEDQQSSLSSLNTQSESTFEALTSEHPETQSSQIPDQLISVNNSLDNLQENAPSNSEGVSAQNSTSSEYQQFKEEPPDRIDAAAEETEDSEQTETAEERLRSSQAVRPASLLRPLQYRLSALLVAKKKNSRSVLRVRVESAHLDRSCSDFHADDTSESLENTSGTCETNFGSERRESDADRPDSESLTQNLKHETLIVKPGTRGNNPGNSQSQGPTVSTSALVAAAGDRGGNSCPDVLPIPSVSDVSDRSDPRGSKGPSLDSERSPVMLTVCPPQSGTDHRQSVAVPVSSQSDRPVAAEYDQRT